MMKIPPEIRDLLACPRCHGSLDDASTDDAVRLRCAACAVAYPVEQGIPVLLADRATPAPALGTGGTA